MYLMIEKTGAYAKLKHTTVDNMSMAPGLLLHLNSDKIDPDTKSAPTRPPITRLGRVIRPVSIMYQKRGTFRMDFATT